MIKGGAIERLVINQMASAIINNWSTRVTTVGGRKCIYCNIVQASYFYSHRDDCIVLVAAEYIRSSESRLKVPESTDDPTLLE